MKIDVNQELNNLDAIDKLQDLLGADIEQIKQMDTKTIIGKASKALIGGSFSLSDFGLSDQFFRNVEMFIEGNRIARARYRQSLTTELPALENKEGDQ